MTSPAQRATLVLENVSAVDDPEHEGAEEPWCVVAYLILDSGLRKRATLCRRQTREEASKALEDMWRTISRMTLA